MAVTNKQLVDNAQAAAANTPESIYTSPSTGSAKGTIITNFTAANSTAIGRSYKAYIVESGGSADIPIIPARTILSGETDISAEIAGQVIPAGASIYVETSAASSISFTVSGKELS